jgi:ATP-binding cassette subfamily B protein
MNRHVVKDILTRMLPYWFANRGWFVFFFIAILFRELSILFEPQIYKQIVESFQNFTNGTIDGTEVRSQALHSLKLYIGVQCVILAAFILQFYTVNRFQVKVMSSAAQDFITHVLNLSFRFHSNRKTGTLSKEFARGISALEAIMDAIMFNWIPLVIRVTGVTIVFWTIDWRLAAIVFFMVIFFMTITVVVSVSLQKKRTQANDSDDEGVGRIIDALMNAELVKYYQQEATEAQLFANSRVEWKRRKLQEWDSWIFVGSLQMTVVAIAVSAILWILLSILQLGQTSASTVVVIVSYVTVMAGILWEVQWNIRRFIEGITDANKFFAYFKEEQEIVDSVDARPLQVTDGAIRFEAVEFGYSDTKTIMKGLTLDVAPRSSLALVGPSGVGKSTIVKLLYRFYDPQSGSISIDGQNIADVTQLSLREQLSIVPQETALFNETIGYNIAYGRDGASQEDIERVAKLAHIHEFIMGLPDKYETLVGERGVKLSGGEKQRISIARALLRNTPIVILDEPTSSLDSASEQEIQAALENLMKQRTVVIIAHRLSTIMHSDKIAVINKGVVSEQGTHDELLQQNGLYHKLWSLQAGGYIPEIEGLEEGEDNQ